MQKSFLSVLFAISLFSSPVWAGVDFDGTDDFIDADSYVGISGTNARSLSFWFKTTSTATGNNVILGWGDNGTGAGEGFRFGHESGVIWGRFNTGVTANWGSGLNDGVWHHFTYSFASAGANQDAVVYIDGVLETGTFANGATALNTEALRVVTTGKFPAGTSDFYNGDANEIAIWNTNLSAAQQISLFTNVKRFPLQVASSNLVTYLPLDDCSNGASGDAVSFLDMSSSRNAYTGDDGANNTGMTCKAEEILSYP